MNDAKRKKGGFDKPNSWLSVIHRTLSGQIKG